MSIAFLIISCLCVILVIALIIIFFYLKRSKKLNYHTSQYPSGKTQTKIQTEEDKYDLAILDESGAKLIEAKEIRHIPVKAHRLIPTNSAVHRVKYLTSDLLKGSLSVPNKTIEVVFSPEIQKGLAEGTHTLMKTKSGEVLADAIDSSTKRIAGKGRLVEGGKARQLVSVSFQLVSIAVAQSHLADIERSLDTIKDSITEVLNRQENEDKAKISGAFDYLNEIALYMKELRSPEELSYQKRNAIESIVKDSYVWRNKLAEDMSSLTNQIKNLQDLDTFGTGATYERIKDLVVKADPLLQRHELFLNLAAATNFVTTYLDPKQTEFSRIKFDSEKWKRLVEDFKDTTIERSSKTLSNVLFNTEETLILRNERIKSLTLDRYRIANEQQNKYEAMEYALEKSLKNLIDNDGKVHVAMSFDEQGEVREAAIL